MPAQRFVGDAPDHLPQTPLQCRPALGGVERAGLHFPRPENVDQRPGGRQNLLDRRRAARAGEIVGVLSLRQKGEAQATPWPDQRQGGVDGPVGGLPASLVAVEAQDRLLGHPPHQVALVGRQRRAHGRDHVRKARRAHGDDVDIALDRDHRATVMGRLAGVVMIVERRPLVKERRLRRIQIFGRHVLFERPPAKGDDLAGAVGDGKHHPVAEAVVGHGNVVAVDQHARFDHLIDAGPLGGQIFAQGEALVGRVSQPELALDLRAQPAVGEIAARPRADRRLQLFLEKFRREFQHVLQGSAGLFPAGRLGRHLRQG